MPAVAFHQGALDQGGGNHLYYLWCNATCTAEESWAAAPVGLGENDGRDVALALDGQCRPQIAYRDRTKYGLGFAWCNTNCESPTAQWVSMVAESADEINRDLPAGTFGNCPEAYWFGGFVPSLALDAAGNPRIAYEADLSARCVYNSPTGPVQRIERLLHTVGYFTFPRP